MEYAKLIDPRLTFKMTRIAPALDLPVPVAPRIEPRLVKPDAKLRLRQMPVDLFGHRQIGRRITDECIVIHAVKDLVDIE